MTLSQSDYYPGTYYIFFVNNDVIITSLLHFSAGRGTRSPSQRNCPAAEANDTRLHTTNTVATQQPRPKPCGLCSVGHYAAFTRRSRMSANCVNRLWKNGNTSASMWLTMTWSDSGAGDCKFVGADGGQLEHSPWLTFWLPQWTSLSVLKCLTILYRLHCYLFSIVFTSAD